jgi:hypothetical protein
MRKAALMGLVRQMCLEAHQKASQLQTAARTLPKKEKQKFSSDWAKRKKAMLGCAANEKRKKMINKFVGNEDS